MKVLHVIPSIAWRYGGTTATIRSLCSQIARMPGMHVELATTDADGSRCRLSKKEVPDEYEVHVFRRTATERWKYSRDLGIWLHENARRFDILHIHALWSYASKAAARAAERSHVPYIIRPAGMLSDYTFHRRSWNKRIYWRWIERRTVHRAAAFHATSSAEQKEILRACPGANVYVILNGVDEDAWRVQLCRNLAMAELRESHKTQLRVLFLSRLHPKKGIVDILLPAWSQVTADAVLVIAGGDDPHAPGYAQQVRDEIARLGLATRVQLLGEISPDRRWGLYDSADLFVLPSHAENFGIVTGEAMARGCPLIISNLVQASDHVIAANAGSVVPCNVQAFALAMNAMLTDVDRRLSAGNSAREYARTHLDWRQVAACVRYMYEQTASTNGRN
jgi:glycosyltransferase involved in cell wall biosynthesis